MSLFLILSSNMTDNLSMRFNPKIFTLLVTLLFFVSCDEDQLSRSRYGENREARPGYIKGLNKMIPPFIRTGSGFSNWVNDSVSGPTSEFCPAANETDVGEDIVVEMSDDDRSFLEREVGAPPPPGGGVNTQLPDIDERSSDVYKYGYFRYKDGDGNVFGTERTIWRLKAAGKLLAKENIVMGVGELSQKGGGDSGHVEHRGGQDADLRLINKDGVASQCTVNDKSCYDMEKTFTMIKTLIDVDPGKVDKILINDEDLRKKINNYYKAKTGSSRDISRSCSGHHDHVHFSWKS